MPFPAEPQLLGLPSQTINLVDAAVAIAVDTSGYDVTAFGGFQLKLERRLVIVDKTGVLADWRVHCKAPTLITEKNVMGAPHPEIARRLPLKSYSEALRELSLLLARLYMVSYDCESVLNALRL